MLKAPQRVQVPYFDDMVNRLYEMYVVNITTRTMTFNAIHRTFVGFCMHGKKKLLNANASGYERVPRIAEFFTIMRMHHGLKTINASEVSLFLLVALYVVILSQKLFSHLSMGQTQSELARCLIELTRPKISHFTEEDLREQDEAYLASLPKPKPLPTVVERQVEKVKQPALSKEEGALRERWSRLLEMVHKGRLDALKSFLGRESASMGGIDAQIPDWAGEKQATIFQIAVALGHEEMTRWFLEEARVDPTIPVPSRKAADDEDANNSEVEADGVASKGGQRTAYDLATKKSIRDIFRRAAATHPEWWDWFGAARVPSALSQGMEEDREEKKKTKRKVLKDRIRERQARENEREKDPPRVHEIEEAVALVENATSRRLGGSSGATDGIAGLTPEMRAKVERERRARAAETRLKSTRQSLDA